MKIKLSLTAALSCLSLVSFAQTTLDVSFKDSVMTVDKSDTEDKIYQIAHLSKTFKK